MAPDSHIVSDLRVWHVQGVRLDRPITNKGQSGTASVIVHTAQSTLPLRAVACSDDRFRHRSDSRSPLGS
jgi:hypothetical protein